MKIRYLCIAIVASAFLLGSQLARAAVPYCDLLARVAPGPDGKIDVLSVTAYPDDESIYAGGALVKLKKDPRVRLHVVCMTNGDASDARFFMAVSREEMARIRAKELLAATAALGGGRGHPTAVPRPGVEVFSLWSL